MFFTVYLNNTAPFRTQKKWGRNFFKTKYILPYKNLSMRNTSERYPFETRQRVIAYAKLASMLFNIPFFILSSAKGSLGEKFSSPFWRNRPTVFRESSSRISLARVSGRSVRAREHFSNLDTRRETTISRFRARINDHLWDATTCVYEFLKLVVPVFGWKQCTELI